MNTVKISLEEYLSAIKLSQKLTKLWLAIIFILISLVLFVGMDIFYFHIYEMDADLVGGGIGGVIGGLFVYFLQRFFVMPWRAKKIYLQQKSLKMPYTYSWSSAGLSVSGENVSSVTPWENYRRWRENKLVYNLYHSDAMFQVIPKRLFTDESGENEFRSYLAGIKNA